MSAAAAQTRGCFPSKPVVGGEATGSAGEPAWEGVGKPQLQKVCSSLLKPAQPSCGGPKINSFDICPLENEKL